MAQDIKIQRLYDAPASSRGYRVFIDRLWPRGLSKQDFTFDVWCKDLAPSPALRTWFGHKVANWPGFCEKYRSELREEQQQKRLSSLLADAGTRDIVLLYGARDAEHNHALVLAQELKRLCK